MPIKITEVPSITSIAIDDLILVYNQTTQVLSKITPTDLVTGGSGELNVQADWDETNVSDDAYILNKPVVQHISELVGDSTIEQAPIAEGYANAITITFGTGGTSTDTNLTLGSDGVLTINNTTTEEYLLDVQVRIGRDSATGEAEILAWEEVSTDGGAVWIQVPGSHTQHITLDDSTDVKRELAHAKLPVGTASGTKFRFRFAQGAGGPAEGKLIPVVMSGDFTPLANTPSATLSIKRVTLA